MAYKNMSQHQDLSRRQEHLRWQAILNLLLSLQLELPGVLFCCCNPVVLGIVLNLQGKWPAPNGACQASRHLLLRLLLHLLIWAACIGLLLPSSCPSCLPHH